MVRTLLLATLVSVGAMADTEHPACVTVPMELFRSAQDLFPEGLPEDARIAGAGRTLGVLGPRLPEGHQLTLIRRGRRHSEIWLPAPKERPFPRQPAFFLGDDGNVAALRTREFFAVYVGGTLTAVVDPAGGMNIALSDRIYWALAPLQRSEVTGLLLSRDELLAVPERERPALLMRSELDGTGSEVLMRLDPARMGENEDDGLPLYQSLLVAIRSDRKLWLVGPWTDEVILASSGGTVERRFPLDLKLSRPEDDPEVRARRDEEARERIQAGLEAARTDATRRRPGRRVYQYSSRSRSVLNAFARGRDLVLIMDTEDPPRGSVVVVDSATETLRCLRLPPALLSGAPRLAVTEDAIWFLEPFGSISWFDIEQFLEPDEEHQSEKTEPDLEEGEPAATPTPIKIERQ